MLRCRGIDQYALAANHALHATARRSIANRHPKSASGVKLTTIDDETGVASVILWADRFEK
jgi:hypothetical protein